MPGFRRDVLRGDADGRAMEDMELDRALQLRRESRGPDRPPVNRSERKQMLRDLEMSERAFRMDEAGGGGVGLSDAARKESYARRKEIEDMRNALNSKIPDRDQKDFKAPAMKRGGAVKKMASGGAVKSSASSRADGCAARGKTKGRMV